VGILAALDYCVASSEKMKGEFLARTAEKQYQRYLAVFNRQTVCCISPTFVPGNR
jgi:hypothetical protein